MITMPSPPATPSINVPATIPAAAHWLTIPDRWQLATLTPLVPDETVWRPFDDQPHYGYVQLNSSDTDIDTAKHPFRGRIGWVTQIALTVHDEIVTISLLGTATSNAAFFGRLMKRNANRIWWYEHNATYRSHRTLIGVGEMQSMQRSVVRLPAVKLELWTIAPHSQDPVWLSQHHQNDAVTYEEAWQQPAVLTAPSGRGPARAAWLRLVRSLGVPVLDSWAEPLWSAGLFKGLVRVAHRQLGCAAWQIDRRTSLWLALLHDLISTTNADDAARL